MYAMKNKFLFLGLISFALVFAACKNEEKKVNKKSYEEQKQTLADKEKNNPKQFLQLTGDDHKNIWGKTVYNGIIKNAASVVAYRDIRVKLLYYKSHILVANHEEFFNNTIAPGDDYSFKAKYKTPKGTDSVASYIMSAKAVQ
jgi:hypothetical protein